MPFEFLSLRNSSEKGKTKNFKTKISQHFNAFCIHISWRACPQPAVGLLNFGHFGEVCTKVKVNLTNLSIVL